MKKIAFALSLITVIFCISACGSMLNSENTPAVDNTTSQAEQTETQQKQSETQSVTSTTTEENTTTTQTELPLQPFEPQDVSDETISSIQTYNDYLIMFNKIIEDYLNNYQEVFVGTPLYDEVTFENMKQQYADAFESQKDMYGEQGDMPIIGRESIIEYLITYRDSLKDATDRMKKTMDEIYS